MFNAYRAFRSKKDWGLIVLTILFFIFVASFACVNILKFRIFSPTCFGWPYPYIYSKLASGRHPSAMYVLAEYPALFLLATPINFLFAVFYQFIPHPVILFVLQSGIMAGGAFPIYLLVKKYLANGYMAFAFSISYLFNPIVTTGAMLGYIPPSVGLLFLLYAFYYLEKADLKKFIFFIVLANMSKIDIVLMTIILGLILSFSGKKAFGKAIFRIGLIWLAAAILFCFVYLKMANRPFPVPILHCEKYGDKLIDVLRYVFNNFSLILKNLFNVNNMLVYAFNRLPNIFSLLSPLYILPIVPEIIFILIRNQHSSGHFLILPFVFAGALYGIKKAVCFIGEASEKIGWHLKCGLLYKALAIFICIFSLAQHYYAKPKCDFLRHLGPMPFTRDFSLGFYRLKPHDQLGYRFLRSIPSSASCLTLQSLAPHLGRCSYLGLFNKEVLAADYSWDYIFLDLYKDDFYHISKNEFFLNLKKFLTQKNYGAVIFEDGWLLLKRLYAQDKNKEVLGYINKFLPDEKGL